MRTGTQDLSYENSLSNSNAEFCWEFKKQNKKIIYIYYYNYIYIIKQDRSKTKISGGTNALIFHNFGLKLGFCSVVLIVIPKTGKENAPECL